MPGLFVTGTDTGVGKTHIAAALANLLIKQGISVRPRKPVESGCKEIENGLLPADAVALKTASASTDALDLICPYQFIPAVSPERAATQAGITLSLDDLEQACLADAKNNDFLLVEAAGGFYSPLAHGVRCSELAQRLKLPVLLVVGDRLGCINHALLTADAIKHAGLELVAVVINQPMQPNDPEMDNFTDLRQWFDCPLVPTSFQSTTGSIWENIAKESSELSQLAQNILS